MDQVPSSKSVTRHIAISEPDETLLRASLEGRNVSPELGKFLANLLRTKKWTRKITLPSTHEDVAVALVYTSSLKEGGLEILSELHVFFAGKTIVEEWQVVGESEKTSNLPKEMFTSINIQKVMVDQGEVIVELSVPLDGGTAKVLAKRFDFSVDRPGIRAVPHPLLEEGKS